MFAGKVYQVPWYLVRQTSISVQPHCAQLFQLRDQTQKLATADDVESLHTSYHLIRVGHRADNIVSLTDRPASIGKLDRCCCGCK